MYMEHGSADERPANRVAILMSGVWPRVQRHERNRETRGSTRKVSVIANINGRSDRHQWMPRLSPVDRCGNFSMDEDEIGTGGEATDRKIGQSPPSISGIVPRRWTRSPPCF